MKGQGKGSERQLTINDKAVKGQGQGLTEPVEVLEGGRDNPPPLQRQRALP